MLVLVAEGRNLPVRIELQVVEEQDALPVDLRLIRATYDQSAVQAALELLGLVRVRVVPVGPGVRDDEPVLEGLTGLDRCLHRLGSVHLGGNANSVPMDRRRLGQAVSQADLEFVADFRLDQRARNLTVVSKAADFSALRELPLDLSRIKLDGNHARTLVQRS